jgi:hypothetical protein
MATTTGGWPAIIRCSSNELRREGPASRRPGKNACSSFERDTLNSSIAASLAVSIAHCGARVAKPAGATALHKAVRRLWPIGKIAALGYRRFLVATMCSVPVFRCGRTSTSSAPGRGPDRNNGIWLGVQPCGSPARSRFPAEFIARSSIRLLRAYRACAPRSSIGRLPHKPATVARALGASIVRLAPRRPLDPREPRLIGRPHRR